MFPSMPMRFPGSLLATVALLAAVVLAPSSAVAAPGPSRLVVATPHDGVRLIGDLRVGPLGSSTAVSTLAEVRGEWGRESTLTPRSCTAGWGTGVRLLFTTFGGPSPCRSRFLQQATVFGPNWKVSVGSKTYAIGASKSVIPSGAKRIRGWNGGGFELATMPFPAVGGPTTTVMAHVNRQERIDRFVLFVGGAGD